MPPYPKSAENDNQKGDGPQPKLTPIQIMLRSLLCIAFIASGYVTLFGVTAKNMVVLGIGIVFFLFTFMFTFYCIYICLQTLRSANKKLKTN